MSGKRDAASPAENIHTVNTVECYSKMTFYFILKQTGKNQSQIPSREHSACMCVSTCVGASSFEQAGCPRSNRHGGRLTWLWPRIIPALEGRGVMLRCLRNSACLLHIKNILIYITVYTVI